MAMNEDLGILIAEFDANVSHLEGITVGLNRQQFHWRPEQGAWSIGECIGHLNVVNGGDIAPIRAAIEVGRARGLTGPGPYHYGFLSNKFVASMAPPAKKKFKAPKVYLPPADAEPAATIAEYRRISAELRKLAASADGLDLALRSFVKMPLGARLALIATHDSRHLWQAEQVRHHPQFPS
jgi:DinB superfamily